jgi:AraC family transcriptional activator of pobA
MTVNIPIHTLKELTDNEIRIDKIVGKENEDSFTQKGAHKRSDHYLFIFQKTGSSKLVVDFNELELNDSVILCILPGQVHYGISIEDNTEVWLINLDISFIDVEFKKIFSDYYLQTRSFSLTKEVAETLDNSIKLLTTVKHPEWIPLLPQVAQSMINACIGIFASVYSKIGIESYTQSRTFLITKQFHHLLTENYKRLKKITDYSELLSISSAYLNEAVKKTTGLTASYWIQQTTISEAKRLLYNTESSIKEVAYELGFTDHAYFSTYFSKAEGISPVAFRARYRQF